VWRVVLRNHQLHRMRLVLVCLAIAVGVAFLSATFILTDTDHAAIASVAEGADANVSVAVQGPFSSSHLRGLAGHASVPQSVVARVGAVAGVAQVEGEVDGYAQLLSAGGALVGGDSAAARGVSVGSVAALAPFVLSRGRLPSRDDQVVVDAQTLAAQRWHLGQTVRIATAQPVARFVVVGTITSRHSSDVLGSTLVGFTVAEAQHLFGRPGQFSVVLATARAGVAPSRLVAGVTAAIGPSEEVLSGSDYARETDAYSSTGVPTFSTVLDVVLGVALFVGALVIFNIISIMVAQRRKEVALLRCLGSSKSQIYRSVLTEAAALGFLASGVGLCMGIVAAALLKDSINGVGTQTSAAGLDITWGTVAVSLVVGTVVTAVASLLPAVHASNVAPVSALSRDATEEATESGTAWRRNGLITAVTGLALLSIGLWVNQGDQVEIGLVGAAMVLTLFGLARLSPLIIPPLVAALSWPLRRLAGLPGRLAHRNVTRNVRRTTTTAAALVIGVALVSLLAIVETSARSSSNDQLSQALAADFEVTHSGVAPLSSGPSGSQPLSPLVLARLRAQPGLVVSPFSFVSFTLNGVGNYGAAIEPSVITHMITFGAVKGSVAALAQGGIAASSQQAAAAHLFVGEKVHVALVSQLQSGSSTTERVDAIYPHGDLALSGYLFSSAAAMKIDPSLALSAVLVKPAAGVSQSQAARIVSRAVSGFSDVSVQDVAQVLASEDQSIASQINLISVLLVLAIAVALLGIVNTLALSVVERTPELAMLRAVGMTRAQMRAMIRSEAALIGMVGALLGVILGLFLGWVFQRALSSQGITDLVVPWARLVAYVVAGAATGLIAGTIPARRAARVDMLSAIASE
jgi:putative ABC transport system permease protein